MSRALDRLRDWKADTAVVLGSGLTALLPESRADKVSYAEFDALPRPAVRGNAGRFELARAGNSSVIYALGRVHLYEGYSALDVTALIRLLSEAGIQRVVLTNAAGTINPDFAPGAWMMLNDHLNLTGTTPLLGQLQFIDLSDAYSARWRAEFRKQAKELRMTLHEGVYAGLLGPQYETPAEVRMLRTLGADAVGMSTVLETIQAKALGLEVAAFSCLTNSAAGVGHEALRHADVLTVGASAAGALAALLSATLARRF